MKKLISIAVVAILMVGCASRSITSADGHRYRLVRPAVKLPDGTELISEYERAGEPGARFAMGLTPKGVKPSFWRLQ